MLRARKQANYVKQEKELYAALREIWPDQRRRGHRQAVAMMGIGMMRLATERWREDPHGHPLARELDRVFLELRKAIKDDD